MRSDRWTGSGIGGYMAGEIGALYSTLTKPGFFMFVCVIGCVASDTADDSECALLQCGERAGPSHTCQKD